MDNQYKSLSSYDTISIKLTQNNLPSATIIKTSLDQISLTYTVSLQNISDQYIFMNSGRDNVDLSISMDNQSVKSLKDSIWQDQDLSRPTQFNSFDKEVFKKKSILKISNIGFSSLLNRFKDQQSPSKTKTKKFFVRPTNSAFFTKNRNFNNQILTQSKNFSSSKQTIHHQSTLKAGQNIMLRTTKLYSIKNDKIIDPEFLRKKSISITREFEGKDTAYSKDRKLSKLPLVKGSTCHNNASNSFTHRRKAFTSYQNTQISDRITTILSHKMIQGQKVIRGKSYKINQNDQMAKKYLQKIILNRNSIIHYNEPKQHRISRQFKENYEEYCL